MKATIKWFTTIIIMSIVVAFVALLLSRTVHAEDIIVTYYGQGVVSIECDGIIHVMGKGKADKFTGQENFNPGYRSIGPISELEKAENAEAEGRWGKASFYYKNVGEIGKMKEMAYKEIERELAKTPPYYNGASMTAMYVLKDRELAMEYFEKHLDRELQME